MTNRYLASAAVSLAVVFWGVSFVAAKAALQILSPYSLLFLRFSLAALVLGLIRCWKTREKISPEHIPAFILLGLMEPSLYYFLETWGLVYTTASAAALIIAATPVFVTLLATVLLKERTAQGVVWGIALTLPGVAGLVLSESGTFNDTGASFKGNLLVLGAVLCSSLFIIVSRMLRSRYSAVTLTSFQVTFSSLFFFPFAGYEWLTTGFPQLSLKVASLVFFLGIFATLLAFLLYNYSLGILDASRVSVFLNAIPLVTVLTAWITLGERLSWLQLLGTAAILLGVLTVTTPPAVIRLKEWVGFSPVS